jgi:hypothetical protein
MRESRVNETTTSREAFQKPEQFPVGLDLHFVSMWLRTKAAGTSATDNHVSILQSVCMHAVNERCGER